MTHFIPVKADEIHSGYLCYVPVEVDGQKIHLPCHILKKVPRNARGKEKAEISIIGDVFNTVIWKNIEDLYDMVA